jgi:lipopolysaccharide export LptBFGC system permease protein LptF
VLVKAGMEMAADNEIEEYTYTKILGIIVGMLVIIAGAGFGLLYFIGMGLSKAWNTGHEYSSAVWSPILILFIVPVFGLMTMIGGFKLKRRAGAMFYIVFCILLGIGFIVIGVISFGALGVKSEMFLLSIGVIYLGLGYLAINKK